MIKKLNKKEKSRLRELNKRAKEETGLSLKEMAALTRDSIQKGLLDLDTVSNDDLTRYLQSQKLAILYECKKIVLLFLEKTKDEIAEKKNAEL